MAQNTSAVKRELMAYTSPSTALNQKVSLKQYASAPTAPEPKIAIARATLLSSFLRGLCPLLSPAASGRTRELSHGAPIKRLAKKTMVKYNRKMVRALRMAFMAFTATAACSGFTGMVKKRATNWNTGFPGGCPTSSL